MGFKSGAKSKVASASVYEHSCILEFLPGSVQLFASSLPSCDQAVLAYFVAFVPRNEPIAIPYDTIVGNFVRKPQQNVANPAASKPKAGGNGDGRSPSSIQHADSFSSSLTSQFADISFIVEKTDRSASPSTTHSPTFGCYCFSCYSDIWRKWNTSPNRGVIDRVLDLFDRYYDDSGHKHNPPYSSPSEGKKRAVKKQSLLKDLSGMTEPGCRIGELRLPKRGIDGKIEAANGDFESVEEEVIRGASETIAIMKKGIAEEVVEKIAQSSSPLCKITPTKNAVPGFALDRSFSRKDVQNKNCAKQRRGKRRSKQVIPLDCEGSEAVKEEGASGEESANGSVSPIALRVEGLSVRGRGFLGQVFPGALGGVATRLWDLISLRLRSHTMNFY